MNQKRDLALMLLGDLAATVDAFDNATASINATCDAGVECSDLFQEARRALDVNRRTLQNQIAKIKAAMGITVS